MSPLPTPADERRRLARELVHAPPTVGALALLAGWPGGRVRLDRRPEMDAGRHDEVASPATGPAATTR